MTVKKPVRPSRERANPFNREQNKEYITDPVFLIGNGKSRSHFDLERLRGVGTIIGCNALYRDFTPDILIAIDSKMINEIRAAKYEGQVLLPGNRSVDIPNAFKWRTDRFNTSGCFAMKLIMQTIQPSECYMLGMDGYPGNMYDNTKNYAVNSLQNFSGVNQYYSKTLKEPGDTMFINVNETDAWEKECHTTGKYKVISYTEFEEKLSGNFNNE